MKNRKDSSSASFLRLLAYILAMCAVLIISLTIIEFISLEAQIAPSKMTALEMLDFIVVNSRVLHAGFLFIVGLVILFLILSAVDFFKKVE